MPTNSIAFEAETKLGKPIPYTGRNAKILAHYQRLWDEYPEKHSVFRMELLRDHAIRDICGANGGKAEQRREPRS